MKYDIVVGSDVRTRCSSREEAVDEAKRLSRRTFNEVRVLNAGRWERLEYRRGHLQGSTTITPDRRGRAEPLS